MSEGLPATELSVLLVKLREYNMGADRNEMQLQRFAGQVARLSTLNPDDQDAPLARMIINIMLRKREEAISASKRLLQLSGRDCCALMNAATMYVDFGMLSEAWAMLNEAHEKYPYDTDLNRLRANIAMRCGRFRTAMSAAAEYTKSSGKPLDTSEIREAGVTFLDALEVSDNEAALICEPMLRAVSEFSDSIADLDYGLLPVTVEKQPRALVIKYLPTVNSEEDLLAILDRYHQLLSEQDVPLNAFLHISADVATTPIENALQAA